MAKVTLVGASSVLWSPKILGDFYVVPDNPIDEICLNSRSQERIEPIAALCKRFEDVTGRKFRIRVETDLEKAVEGADFVVTAIAVGGLDAMQNDLDIPEKYGTFATVGDSVGPGGFSRLLRNVPVFTDLAQRIEKAAPDAWLLNVSNPLSGITKHITETVSMKSVGVCFGIVNHIWVLKDLLGFNDISEVDYTVAGIDHCSWFLDLKVNGEDVYPGLREMSLEELEEKATLNLSKDEWMDLDSLTAGFTLFKRLNYLPAISDRHVGEFFPYFLKSEDHLKMYNMKRTGITHRKAWSEGAKKKLEKIISGEEEPKLEKTRDIVVDLINALAGSGPVTTTVNYPNKGQVKNLPEGAIVETTAKIDTDSIEPIPAGPLPDRLLAIVLPHILREELALKAGQEGSREHFIAALTSDPTVKDLDGIVRMAEEMIQANINYLPQFNIRE